MEDFFQGPLPSILFGRILLRTILPGVGLLGCAGLVSAGAAESLPPVPAVTAVPAAPQVVIQGGELPRNWTPVPVACSGMGPDGRPIVVHVAPTYVFTLASGPPVPLASPAVGVVASRPAPTGVSSARPVTQAVAMRPSVPYGSNWVFQTQGNLPVDSAGLLSQRAEPPAPPSTWAQAAPIPGMAAPAAAAIGSLPPPPQSWQPVQDPPPVPVPPPQPQVLASIPPPQTSPAPPPIVPIPFVPPQPTAGTAIAQPTGRGVGVASRTWRVVGVQDGDTLTCLDESGGQQRVRLAGIDAPEIGQDFGRQSRDALADLVFGRAVEVVDEGRDRQGRTIAKVLVDGDDVNRRMVSTGMAWHYSAYSTDPDLDGLEAEARAGGRGLWSQPAPIAPWDYRRSAAAGGTVASLPGGHSRPTA